MSNILTKPQFSFFFSAFDDQDKNVLQLEIIGPLLFT